MKANRAPRARHRASMDDRAAAGVVAGVLMVGGIVAFLAYMNTAWVPRWIESKESVHAAGLNVGISSFADLTESQIARNQTSRSYSTTFTLGVRGIAILGTGSSAGSLVVADGPTLNVSVASLPVLTAGGSLALDTRTTQYPNQTYRYTLGAMEIVQADGAWVDLRNMLQVTRVASSGTGALSLVIQTVNITSGGQQVGGSGEAQALGVVTNITTTTDASSGPMRVHLSVNNVQAGAWRAALNRTLSTQGLTGAVDGTASNCGSATTHYCFPSLASAGNNTATRAEVVLLSVTQGWVGQSAKVAVTVTG